MHFSHIRSRWFLLALSVLLATTGTGVFIGTPPAQAAPPQPISEHSIELIAEQYNLARYRIEQTTAALERTERRITEARAKSDALRELARSRAAYLYRQAAGDGPQVLVAENMNDLARRTEYINAAAVPDREMLKDLGRSVNSLAKERAAQQGLREQLRGEAAAATAAKNRLEREAAAAKARPPAPGDGAGPVGAAPAKPTATAPTATAAKPVTSTPQSPTPQTVAPSPATPPAPVPPTATPPVPVTSAAPAPAVSGKAATAVAYARAQLGKPYVFATSGPDSFDCSGLTMSAWRAAGVSMPHYSGAQAAKFPKVTWEQLQPGDIVAFYADLHHVGIYIGDGKMIHAPQTGDVVKIATAWRTTFQFGVRPG